MVVETLRAGLQREALAAYREAAAAGGGMKEEERVRMNLAIANAALRAGEPVAAFEVCVDTVHDLVSARAWWWATRSSTCSRASQRTEPASPPPLSATTSLARCSAGGPAMFTGEDPAPLRSLQDVVLPPAALGT